jgi:OMF family outer membrane factor
MLVYRFLMGASTSLLLLLTMSNQVNAQELVHRTRMTSNRQSPDQSEKISAQRKPLVIVQSLGEASEASQEKNIPPADANGSANPLLFPTQPQEVKIDKVKSISLDQAIELALKNNKDLQVARLTLERSQEGLRAAKAQQLPTVDTQVDFDYTDSAAARRQNAIINQNDGLPGPTTSTNLNGTVGLNYNIYTGGRVSAEIKRAERQVKFDELQVEVTAQQTRFDATESYYQLQTADALVAIQQARMEDATQTLRDAQLLEQAGLGTRFDVLRAEVELANANQALTQSISDQRRARRSLARVLSIAQDVELTAADPIREAGNWDMPLDESIVRAYKNRAELEQLLVQKEIFQQDRKIAISQIRPTVSLFFDYNFLDNFDDSVGVEDGYSTGARLNWRIFDGGRAAALAKQADKDVEIDETQFANQRNSIRLEVEEAYFEMIANRENIQTTQKAVETATESLRLARLRFQAGVGTQTDVINSQTELTTARGNFLRAIAGYNLSLNRLQRAVSNLPDNYLAQFQ